MGSDENAWIAHAKVSTKRCYELQKELVCAFLAGSSWGKLAVGDLTIRLEQLQGWIEETDEGTKL